MSVLVKREPKPYKSPEVIELEGVVNDELTKQPSPDVSIEKVKNAYFTKIAEYIADYRVSLSKKASSLASSHSLTIPLEKYTLMHKNAIHWVKEYVQSIRDPTYTKNLLPSGGNFQKTYFDKVK